MKIQLFFIIIAVTFPVFSQTSLDKRIAAQRQEILEHYKRIEKNFDLEINISLEKRKFSVLEKIFVDVQIINKGRIGPALDWRTFRTFRLLNENGVVEGASTTYNVPTISPFDTTKGLRQGDVVQASSIDLFDIKGDILLDFGHTTGLPPGNYKLQHYMQYVDQEFQSNIIEFEVLAPTGDDLNAFNIYREARRLQRKKNAAGALKVYENLIIEYPKSYISGVALRQMLFLYQWIVSEHDKELQVCKLILEQHPHMGCNKRAIETLFYCYEALGKRDSARIYLNNLSGKISDPELKSLIQAELMK